MEECTLQQRIEIVIISYIYGEDFVESVHKMCLRRRRREEQLRS